MKEKNLPDDIKSKSLDELREILNNLLNKIETSQNLENSTDEYQKLIKINNLIEKKFQSLSKEINNESKLKIDQITKKNEKKIKKNCKRYKYFSKKLFKKTKKNKINGTNQIWFVTRWKKNKSKNFGRYR